MRPYTKRMVVKKLVKRNKKTKGATISYSEKHREWAVDEAKDFVDHIDCSGGSKGLTYWSAKDFLKRRSSRA